MSRFPQILKLLNALILGSMCLLAPYRVAAQDAELNDSSEGIAESGSTISTPEAPPPTPVEIGYRLYQAGRFAEALPLLQKEPKGAPKKYVNVFAIGTCKLILKDYAGAITTFDEAAKLDPTKAEAYAQRAFCKESLGDKRGAVSDYSKAITLNKTAPALWYFNRGQRLFELNQYSIAANDFAKVLFLEPHNLKAHRLRGDCYFALKDYTKAISDYNAYIRFTGGDADTYIKRADAYFELAQYPRAAHDYTEALHKDDMLIELHERRSICFTRMGRPLQAIQDANELIKDMRFKAHGYGVRAYAQFSGGDRRGAKGDCNACRELTEKDYLEHFVRAMLLIREKNYATAMDELNSSIALNPRFDEAYYNRGVLHCDAGQFERAEADFKKTSELAPFSAAACNNLGYVYLKRLEWTSALEQFNRALKLDANSAEAYSNRAFTQLQLNNIEEAIQDCQSAIKSNPKLAKAHYHLGLALAKRGENQRATTAFAEASKLDPALAQLPSVH